MGFFGRKKEEQDGLRMIPVELIDPNPAQPRRSFERGALEELAQSIKENGLLSPISVRRCRERYQLIAGERRLMAFRMLGEKEIPAIVGQADDRRSAVLALVENLQRRDLNFYEQAMAVNSLILNCGLTQQQAAERLGISQSAVANKLRILRLPDDIMRAMAQAGLTERHARAMLPLLKDGRLKAAVDRVIRQQLTVAQTEKLVAELAGERQPAPKGERILIIKDLRIFNSAIARAIDMMKQAGIDAVSQKTEDEQQIVYTVVIPKKKKAEGPAGQCGQTPAARAL